MQACLGNISLIIVQANSLCNLNCDYCYIPEESRQKNRLLPLEYVETIFRNLFASPYMARQAYILWHAGEPLTVPISYYETFIHTVTALKDELCDPDFKLGFGMQTNATLINQEWCDFIKKHCIGLGVSCDGPEPLHNTYRKDWQGKGSFSKTLRGMQLLKKNDFKLHVLTTLTPDILAYDTKAFLNFYLEQDIDLIGFSPLEKKAGGQADLKEDWLDNKNYEQQYRSFLKSILHIIQTEPEKKWPLIREFKNSYSDILALEMGESYSYGNVLDPLSVMTVDYQGNYSTFSPELLTQKTKDNGNFIFGNLLTDSLESLLENEKFLSMYAEIQAGIEACRSTCDYFSICGGGAPDTKYSEHGTFNSTETTDCRFRLKIPTDVALEALEELVTQTKNIA